MRTINRFTTHVLGARRARPCRVVAEAGAAPLGRFLRFYVLRSGWRLGKPGLFVAVSAAVYVHLKYAKQDERARRAGGEST